MTSVGLTFVHNPDTMLSAFQSQSPIATLAMQKDRASSREKEGIHSGHFMVSRIHGDTSGDYLSDEEQELDKGIDQDSGKDSGFNFKQASQNTCKEYKFGNRTTQTLAIDESLSNLFRHLTLAYRQQWLRDTNQLLERVGEMKELSSFPRQQQTSRTDLLLNSNDVQEMMDLSESLFSNLKQPFDFPNPRELAGYGYGDFIQPSLLQFQPSNLDDIMDFDQLQADLWPTSKSISSDNASATDTSQGGPVLHVPHMDFEMGGSPLNLPASPGMILSPSTPPIQSPHMFDSPSATPSPGHPHSPMNIMETDFIMNHLQQLQQQTKLDQQKKEQEQKMQQNLLQQQRLAEQQKQQQQQQQELQQQKKKLEQQEQIMALLQNNDALKTLILEALNRDESQTKKRMMSHQTQTGKTVQGKKDLAGFIIPQGPPRRQRPLQPSPTNTASQQQSSSNSFLAQLLTTGTYPGAIVGKDDGASRILSQLQAVSQPQTIPQSQPQTINMSDFSTSILLAAVNRAIGPNQVSSSQVFQTVSKQGAVSPMAGIMVSSPVKVESLTPTPSPSASPVPSSTFNFTAMSSPSSNNSSFDDGFTLKSPEALYADLEKTELQSEAHLTAEKKRRTNIKTPGQIQKSGFDLLHTLIPSLRQNPNAKVSKAAMLLKTAEYCKKLKAERSQMQKEADILKQEINSLNHAISVCQSQLPATGVPVTRQRADQMREMFDEYFSLIIDKLFESFNTMVSTASMDELCRTVLAWLDQHCSLPSLRPIVSDAMRHLSTSTSILNDPSRVPEQAAQAVIKRQKHMSGDAGT
ncbi:MLXPL-like protein [Mya arenaria]|uniref:MLXPL-like protein n=1 Tax=Mya arenaria TaxID=6604 RepID=A0ABY7E053_MYAAR|nr:MLXPL-like protein [Mya arenaria]